MLKDIDFDNIEIIDIEKEPCYLKKAIMTESEKKWFELLDSIIDDNYYLIPQVILHAIIEKKYYQKLKYKNQGELNRRVDFGIFRKKDFELMLLIEINDKSHNKNEVKKRDQRVKEICNFARQPLITFRVKQVNDRGHVEEIINQRIEAFN